MSVLMGWPESVSYLLLVVLGYALTRVVDLACDWQRRRLSGATDAATGTASGTSTGVANSHLSTTARQRLMERRAVYARFRKSASEAVECAVNQGHGTYGML